MSSLFEVLALDWLSTAVAIVALGAEVLLLRHQMQRCVAPVDSRARRPIWRLGAMEAL